MAADSAVTVNETHVGDVLKIVRTAAGGLAAGAGRCSECAAFLEWAAGPNRPSDYRASGGHGLRLENSTCIEITPEGEVLFYDVASAPYEIKAPFIAIGSGRDLALGAMAAGATAEEAVRIAARYDAGTGGEINTLMLTHKDTL